MLEALKDTGFKVVNAIHRQLFEASKGRVGGRIGGMPVLILETTGRKSGKRRSTMLTAPIVRGDEVVLVASKGGDDRHPAWYLNLEADPTVAITMGGRTYDAMARVVSSEEKDELWSQIVDGYRGYDSYRKRTDRDIPVIVCTPN